MKKLIYLPICLIFLMSCDADSGGSADFANDPSGNGQAGSLARFGVVSDHLFAVNGQSLKVFDISNMQKPEFKKNENLGVNVETIFARDSKTLFIGTTSGMYIYNIEDAPDVRYISHYEHIVSCDPVVANSDYAFVTLRTENNSNVCWNGTNQLDVVDIRTLENPDLVRTLPMEQPLGLGLHGDTLLVCDDGIKIYDVSDAPNPQLINHLSNIDANDLIPRGDLIIVVGDNGFSQYRFKNGNLQFLSKL